MMRVATVGLIICQITAASQLQGVIENERTDILNTSESRYLPARDYIHRNPRNYNDGDTKKDYDPPAHFNVSPPPFQQHDHWQHNRRTFFQQFPFPDPHPTTTPFPTFYQLMTSLFRPNDDAPLAPPDKFPYTRHRPTPPTPPPYPYEAPYPFTPTQPNYIPPPKPIRASVIKLESVTRSPIYSSFDGESHTKYHHNVDSLFNHVLIENSKAQRDSGLRTQDTAPRVEIPPFKPLSVLSRPRYIPAPTNPTRDYRQFNGTDYKYPDSVQDQLPHLNLGDAQIPYVSEKTIPQIFDTLPTERTPGNHFPRQLTADTFPPHPHQTSTTTNILDLIDIRALNSPRRIPESRIRPPSGEARLELDLTTVRSFPGAVEKVKRPTYKFTKKVSTHFPDKNSVERVANLTVEGLSSLGKEAASKQANYLNVRDLIRYEMERLVNSSRTQLSEAENSSKRLVNLNDELSLDARILKDTNWDGLVVLPTTVSTELPERASTPKVEAKPHEAAFWEIVDESTTLSTTGVPKVTTIVIEKDKVEATTEYSPPTRDGTETEAPSTTTESTTLTTLTTTTPASSPPLRRSENLIQLRPVTEESERLAATTVAERIPKRRYSRRPKIVSFTPYPTTEELHKRLANRTHFPKRQKPNITLAFGNKNVLKLRQSFAKDEVMKFSDEDVRKRRKTGKRRQLYKRKRPSTPETPVREDSL